MKNTKVGIAWQHGVMAVTCIMTYFTFDDLIKLINQTHLGSVTVVGSILRFWYFVLPC